MSKTGQCAQCICVILHLCHIVFPLGPQSQSGQTTYKRVHYFKMNMNVNCLQFCRAPLMFRILRDQTGAMNGSTQKLIKAHRKRMTTATHRRQAATRSFIRSSGAGRKTAETAGTHQEVITVCRAAARMRNTSAGHTGIRIMLKGSQERAMTVRHGKKSDQSVKTHGKGTRASSTTLPGLQSLSGI